MAAYFLPSYFQKRLLRYALSRLDLLDSDALDLDNLGVKIGQRSVIELKNVALKITKLLEKVELPDYVHIAHAVIQVLRITIPADLHVSGIEVEVDGVDIAVEIDHTRQSQEKQQKHHGAERAPSHKDVANRPRTAVTTVHDPGGRHIQKRSTDTTMSQLIPAPEDLAASFLETEPEQERQEVEAAVESRSLYLHQTQSQTIAASNSDIGQAEGFSLPSFVTNFFVGIAERLSVTVKDVAVRLLFTLGSDPPTPDTVEFVLKVDLITLKTTTAPLQDGEVDTRRCFGLNGISLFILVDEDALTQKSSTSSPYLSRSRSTISDWKGTLSKPDIRDEDPTSSPSSPMALSPQFEQPTIDNLVTASHGPGFAREQLGTMASTDSADSLELSRHRVKDGSESSSSPNRIDTEDDLMESKLFSHDEAESMFMSAMSHATSHAVRMPGAFDDLENTGQLNSRPDAVPVQPGAMSEGVKFTDNDRGTRKSLRDVSTSATTSFTGSSSLRGAKLLLHVTDVTLRIPRTKKTGETLASQEADDDRASQIPTSKHGRPGCLSTSMSTSHTRVASEQSVYGIPKDQNVNINVKLGYDVVVGDVDIALDLPLCHTLIRSYGLLSSASKRSNKTEQTSTKLMTDVVICASVKSLAMRLLQNALDSKLDTKSPRPTDSTFSTSGVDDALVEFRISQIGMQTAIRDNIVDSELTLHRVGLYQGTDQVISFLDPSNLQQSMISPSILLDSDDVVLRCLGNRVDVTTKPLHITLNLLVMDDVLGRSGGLSSLLELANSASTFTEQKSLAPAQPKRRRSVHFQGMDTMKSTETPNNLGLKLNMRVSAVVLKVVGSQSSLQVRTTAIKLVQRPGKLRTTITSISVRGPIVHAKPSQEVLNLKFNDFHLLYLDRPEEEDLDRLLQLLAPSDDQQAQDDDIMVDTLLRQRRKGGVVRLTLQDISATATGFDWVEQVSKLGEEISKLSTVTKYLPEDDRPGILVFGLVEKLNARVNFDKDFGYLLLNAHLLEGALISVPSLMAAQISGISLSRGEKDSILREVVPGASERAVNGAPMCMCRFIPDEMEPTVKLKLSNICLEYSVPLLLAFSQLAESLSLSTRNEIPSSQTASQVSATTSQASELGRNIRLSLALSSSAISLKPIGSAACGLLLFSDADLLHSSRSEKMTINVNIRKASIMLIDDVSRLGKEEVELDARLYFDRSDQVQALIKSGFVPVGSISAASADVKVVTDKSVEEKLVDVEFRNSLLFLETCADSTQTLIQVLGNLSPPAPPSKAEKFRTEVVPIADMLASWTGDAFVAEKGPELGMRVDEKDKTPTSSTVVEITAQLEHSQTSSHHNTQAVSEDEYEDEDDEDYLNDLYVSQDQDVGEAAMAGSSSMTRSTHSLSDESSVHIAPVNISADDEPTGAGSIMVSSLIDWRAGHFMPESSTGGTAHRWDAQHDTYDMSNETVVQHSPLKVRVRDVHIIWNLLDGYDWQDTRDTIARAVRDIEDKAYARQRRRDSHRSPGPDDEDESVVGDLLFNSIYISIPTNRDPGQLVNDINMEMGDAASETGSYATSTTITATTSKRQSGPRVKRKKLRLNRSKTHKITFELEGLAADFFAFPPGSGGVESSVDVRVQNLVIYDHVPTSTWKKFATYDRESGEREVGTDMVHIELLNVKPVTDLASSEMVLKVTILPLRLHVDQDALDFMTRFFEFKDEKATPSGATSNPPFIQRAEVNPIKIRLDFKPKRVDYAGLKSGKLTEFMNFIILERSDMVLRRVILYGVSGFDRLGIMLNNIWTPDVRNNQLPGVLAGLAPVRSLVDVGAGVRDLVAVPIREYKKDGRIVRSIQKGAIAFARTTTTELVNLGAKLAIGTQTILQNAEGVLAPQSQRHAVHAPDSEDEEHQISHYADQPLGVVQGLRGAYASLERDLLLAKDAIVAVPGEIMAEGSATGAAKVVLKQTPTIILRPAIGVTTAVGQALLGAGNTLDKGKRRRIEDVSIS